jgi:cell division protein FtsW
MLLLAEPDMGAFMVIAVIAMGILFLGGVNARMFFLIAAVMIVAFMLMIAMSDWRRERIFAVPRSLEREVRAGQGLPAVALADRHRPRRDLRRRPGRQRREAALAARGAHRLPARRDRRGVRPGRRGAADRPVPLDDPRIMHIGRQAIALDRVFAGLVAQGVGIWMDSRPSSTWA